MTLDESVESSSPFKKKILLPAAFLASLFATQAQAQDFASPNKKQDPVEEKVEKKEEERADRVSGYLIGEARTSDRETEIIGKGKFTIDPGNDWRLSLGAVSEWHSYDNENEDLDVLANEGHISIGKYLAKSRKLDVYAEGRLGFGTVKFSDAIDLDGDYFTFGGKFGIASREDGTKLELGIYKSIGDIEYELLSGYKDDGDFDRFYAGAEFTQRLLGKGSRPAALRGDFDVRDLGDEFAQSLHIALRGFYSKDKYGGDRELQDVNSMGLELSLPYVLNFRELGTDGQGNKYIEGHLWEFRPFIQYEHNSSDSGLSVRETDADRFRLGIRAKLSINKWVALHVEGGYEWYNLDVDDPVRGNDSKDYDGFAGGAGLSVQW